MSDSRVKTLSSTTAASISQTNTEADSSNDDWTLQIKMVGEQQADFSITLHPEDDIIQLYNEVTNITGLPHNQQRLIYRGRLLPNSNTLLQQQQQSRHTKRKSVASNSDESLLQPGPSSSQPKTSAMNSTHSSSSSSKPMLNQKIKDIVGLMNGHSIHLVCRPKDENRNETEVTTDDDEEDEEGTPAAINSTRDTDPASTSSTSSTASSSLLAALLGLGSSSTPTSDRGSGYQAQRRHTYRLTEEDLVRPDPGSMESVRQGLMTFHTLQQATASVSHRNQQAVRRHFYLGQWIDCRDTVNQWLEATVVSILYPRDIMHSYHSSEPSSDQTLSNTETDQPTSDPPVAVTDFDGRRRLLLEPCSESEADECIDGIHYRRRNNNDQVQILHIHYNGWPVRWDEWIRSDSERIRVFRTRTRHNTSTTQIHASPNIDSTMPDAPRTYFTNTDNETIDRRALLPELHRAISTLQSHLDVATTSTNTNMTGSISTSTSLSRMAHLPWTGETIVPSTATEVSSLSSRRQKQRELQALAPLLDRLGRVLIDAAPHVLALSEAISEDDDDDHNQGSTDGASNDDLNDIDAQDENEQQNNTHPSTLGGLLSLLSRDRRSSGQRGSVASSNAALPSVVSDVEMSVASSTTDGNHPEPPTAASSSDNIVDPDEDDENKADEEEEIDDDDVELEPIDPDYRDYAGGLVNTFRGEMRNVSSSNTNTTPSNRRSTEDGTSLLGAYLAAMSLSGLTSISASDGEGGGVTEGLGRLLRDRGNGSGIDIHIHAVVTAPGLDGAIGIAALTGGGGGGGTTFPAVATPVTTNGTTAATANGGLGSLLFGGSTRESNRRSGSSRRFRTNTPGPVDATIVEQQTALGITNIIDDNTDLFAELYSETPDPINPNGQADHIVPTATVVDVPNDDTTENNHAGTSTSSPSRLQRSRSRPQVVSSNIQSLGENLEHNHGDVARLHRNDRSASNGSNNNLLRRIFRRPDGSH
jgi:hypothetical protein